MGGGEVFCRAVKGSVAVGGAYLKGGGNVKYQVLGFIIGFIDSFTKISFFFSSFSYYKHPLCTYYEDFSRI